ncbi:uncharacterized protein HMPREF1541_08118 [Cyphellophora europaea CBS 101466]|uniref:Uncharacterized protein n=1 Tax=Cyphellophora europaea (strain CBS 101466) TaxID=1220924 RepID=W2RN42_CYPE1|nr:uncharacterized protein HMPREF1541_08118 [Cyphellophora europaea CBS 101466]ETN37128.1 hypothetical protein HMPREF1541_08118 [Cyphellophora europaea CBS 101466]
MAPVAQPRRFQPQPIEESVKSSRKTKSQHVEHADLPYRSSQPLLHSEDSTEPGFPTAGPPESKPRRFSPQRIETTSRSSRRKFAPEPVETSTRSSKDRQGESKPKQTRRFAPEPVETTSRSHKASKEEDQAGQTTPEPRKKFSPEPISTERISRRQASQTAEHSSENNPDESRSRKSSDSSQSANGTRRFSPDLIETAKGTYRQTAAPSPTKSDHTLRPPAEATEDNSDESDDNVSTLEESRFSAAALAKRHNEENRRHSFMVPGLPMIESDSGDDSSAPSLTNSRSSADSLQRANSRRAAGETYTEYVLKLAAQSATDEELQQQAMAAYINETTHEQVAHYGFDEEDDPSPRGGRFSGENGADVRTFRRSSQDDLDWELKQMQRHHAQLEEAKRQLKHDTAGHSRFSAAALATRHKLEAEKEVHVKKLKAEESEMAKMRAAATPPMLGDDLVFPQTISPKMTRCETDQHPRPRSADSDDDEEEIGQQDLWTTKVKVETSVETGLWGGCCNGSDSRPGTPQRTGLQTPGIEKDNPFDCLTPGRKTPGTKTPKRRVYGSLAFLPLTPPRTTDNEDNFTSSIDKRLILERQIEDEFPDCVITQVYNYLSLGYPSLAWAFDAELSKISRISVEELRKDDNNVDAKGYVGAPEGDGSPEEAVTKGGCRRWEALRLYVREWARQSPGFMEEIDGIGRRSEQWGGNVGVRKGSWAH